MCFTPVLATELGASSISGVDGCLITVKTEKPVSGAVYLTADQSRDDFGCHGAGCHPDTMRFLCDLHLVRQSRIIVAMV